MMPRGATEVFASEVLVPQGTKATSPADGPLKPVLLLYVYSKEDVVLHGKAHQHELGETTIFIVGRSGGNAISYPVQEPIKISHCMTIYCLYATSIFHEAFNLERWY